MFLSKKLPPNMKTPIWVDLLDVIEDECNLAIEQKIVIKKYLYNIEKMSYERLLEVSELLRFPFDVSINVTEEFLRKEVDSIAFKVKNKGTVKIFKSFFQAMKRRGEVFLYYNNGESLIRHSENLLQDANSFLPDAPYFHKSNKDFSGNIIENIRLDDGMLLDDGWRLDEYSTKKPTKHFALETFLDSYFFSGEEGSAPDSGLSPSAGLAPSENLPPSPSLSPQPRIPYLITQEFFSYVDLNATSTKRLTDVIHVGAQLCAVTDSSHHIDVYADDFTMPQLLLNCCTVDAFDTITSVDDMKYIAIGSGSVANLLTKNGEGEQPTSLQNQLAFIKIQDEEKYENGDWFGVCAEYKGFQVNNFKVSAGNGVATSFAKTLQYTPIKRRNIEVDYVSDGVTYNVRDDGYGKLLGDKAVGTIDYENGSLTIETNIQKNMVSLIGTGDEVETSFSFQTEGEIPIIENSVSIQYVINGTSYVAFDDGVGNITGNNCTGTVVYSNGSVTVNFGLAPSGDITTKYKIETFSTPDNGSDILCKYYYEDQQIFVTEAGILDGDKNLLCYATFPRIRFKDFTNHLSMSFIIKKTVF